MIVGGGGFDRPVCVARTIAFGVVRRGGGTASGRASGQGPRGVRVGAASGAAGVVMDHGRAAHRRRGRERGRWELEDRGRRCGGTAARRVVGRRGHAQRRTPGRRVVRRGRRAGCARRRLVMRVRERVDVPQVAADDGTRLVGRFGAGRPPARLMVVRHPGRGHRLLRLVLAGHAAGTGRGCSDGAAAYSAAAAAATAFSVGYVYGRLGPGRAQREVRLRVFGKRRLGRTDFAGRIGTAERAHGAAVRRHGGRCAQQVDDAAADVRITCRRLTVAASTTVPRAPSSQRWWQRRRRFRPTGGRVLRGHASPCTTISVPCYIIIIIILRERMLTRTEKGENRGTTRGCRKKRRAVTETAANRRGPRVLNLRYRSVAAASVGRGRNA